MLYHGIFPFSKRGGDFDVERETSMRSISNKHRHFKLQRQNDVSSNLLMGAIRSLVEHLEKAKIIRLEFQHFG